MAETTTNTPAAGTAEQTEDTPTPNRLQAFVNNHPRASKVVAVTGAALGAVGLVQLTRTLRSNRDHLSSAVDHAGAAVGEVAASVDPASGSEA